MTASAPVEPAPAAPISEPALVVADSAAAAHAAALWPWVQAHGHDAVAFQGLEPGLRTWLAVAKPDADAPTAVADPEVLGGPGAVAYHDTGSAWVAAGGPLAAAADRPRLAGDFAAAARAAGRRASFFCVDGEPQWPGFTRLLLGEQPVWDPAEWPAVVRRHRRLREQLRRATAKGVRVRLVTAAELAPGSALRAALDTLASAWLASRGMEPMGFLVTLAPFVAAAEHRYYLAEQHGRAIALLSLVPVPARQGWLFEDLLRNSTPAAAAAPNGTSELLVDFAMRELAASGARYATTGLAPLSGEVPRWMRAIGDLARPLYDFRGLRRFKQRLHPPRWERVWMCYPRGESLSLHLLDALRAFAPGGLLRFAAATCARRPGVLAWMLGVPLLPWALVLAVLAATGQAALLGFTTVALTAWAIFDGLLAAGLWRASRAPHSRLLGLLACAATLDAALSLHHLFAAGLGSGAALALRSAATLAPLLGAPALWWARRTARRAELARSALAAQLAQPLPATPPASPPAPASP